MARSYFRQIPRRDRAKGLVPKIRRCSKRLKSAVAAGDEKKQLEVSKAAWDAMTQLFEILRGEQDTGHLAAELMEVHTAFIVDKISINDQKTMFSRKKIDHARATNLNLRETLNKLAHYEIADFRVDGRNAHYILLGGYRFKQHWIAEILVSKLCRNASAAIRGIDG